MSIELHRTFVTHLQKERLAVVHVLMFIRFTISTLSGASLEEQSEAFPDRSFGAGCDSAVHPGDPVHYIKTECFTFPTPTTRLGNAGRNSLIGPGLSNLDLSLFKNNHISRISENFNIQFRAEFFNLMNHANFSPPVKNNTLFSASGAAVTTAGLITSTSTSSRQIQFVLKMTW